MVDKSLVNVVFAHGDSSTSLKLTVNRGRDGYYLYTNCEQWERIQERLGCSVDGLSVSVDGIGCEVREKQSFPENRCLILITAPKCEELDKLYDVY